MLLQGGNPNPNPNPSPEFEHQIEQQVESALKDAQIGQQIGEALKQVPWHQVTIIGALTGVLVPLGFFALIGLIIWMQVRRSQARTKAQLELQKQLLDKFTSGREFGEFLESKGGQRFLDNALTQSSPPRAGSNVKWIRTGTFLSVFGLGLLLLSGMRHGFLVGGAVVLALGLGFLISGAVSHRLSEKWAIKPDKPSGIGNEPVSQN